jgi:hypothetical protein
MLVAGTQFSLVTHGFAQGQATCRQARVYARLAAGIFVGASALVLMVHSRIAGACIEMTERHTHVTERGEEKIKRPRDNSSYSQCKIWG